MANEEVKRKRPSEMTLEELTAKETERIKRMKEKTDIFIDRISNRIKDREAEGNAVEVERLKSLLERHKTHREEIKTMKAIDRATERFNKQEERKVKIGSRLSGIK